eukprot:739239-Alexandrium_andersonii.AAC.1
MSASLVGSEMCIRDRSHDTDMPRTSTCEPMPLKGPGGTRRGQGDKRRAVSYTHLTLPTICSV